MLSYHTINYNQLLYFYPRTLLIGARMKLNVIIGNSITSKITTTGGALAAKNKKREEFFSKKVVCDFKWKML